MVEQSDGTRRDDSQQGPLREKSALCRLLFGRRGRRNLTGKRLAMGQKSVQHCDIAQELPVR